MAYLALAVLELRVGDVETLHERLPPLPMEFLVGRVRRRPD
jgi:hypothetical protein